MPESPSKFKRCAKCGAHKPLCEFHHDRAKPDGYRNSCKVCQIAAVKAYQRVNVASIARTKRTWRANNVDKITAAYQRRMANNPNFHRDHYAINRDRELSRKREAARAAKETER